MQTVTSKDGTPIAYAQSGHGPPVVLVHGTTADHTRWLPLLARLEAQFTVCAVDRRGRGGSGDASEYHIEREFEDIAGVIDSIGEPVFLLGHSYGAICALEASLRTDRVRKLVLYEPPVPAGVPIYPPELVARLQAMLDRGERAAVVSTFFLEVARMPPAELKMLQSLPNWPARVAAAHTIPREMQLDLSYHFEAARFAGLRTPTRMLLGGESPPFLKQATQLVNAALPSSEVVVLPGQQHTAMNTAPELFLREVLSFFAE